MSSPKYTDDDLKRVAGIKDEIFSDQLTLALEILADMQGKVNRIPKIEEAVQDLQTDMKVVKVAVRDTNGDLQKLSSKPARFIKRV